MLYSRSVGKGGEILDASAIVPLLVAEPTTRPLQALAEQDPDMLVWCSQVECVSALTRIERAATLDAKAVSTSFERLKQPRVEVAALEYAISRLWPGATDCFSGFGRDRLR